MKGHILVCVLFICLASAFGRRVGLSSLHQSMLLRNKLQTTDCANTDYDKLLAKPQKVGITTDFAASEITAKTAVLVIDMQVDFTTGSFSLPCADRVPKFAEDVANFVKDASAKGATIVATKDFHPTDHCSFKGVKPECINHSDGKIFNNRTNEFPPHCTYTEKDGKVTASEGTKLHPTVLGALKGLSKTHVAFKAFHKTYDSFAAFPHAGANVPAEEVEFTGSYVLKTATGAALDTAIPSADQLKKPSNHSSDFPALAKFLTDAKIDNLIVVGLVTDYCVMETAAFAKKVASAGWTSKVTVLMDLTRPAMDGHSIAGLPLGKTPYLEAMFTKYKDNNIAMKLSKPPAQSSS